MTGGVMLGGARDLILLIVAVETVTIPLYALVGLRRQARAAEASLTFFITSVVATSVALLGAGLIYAATGNVTIGWMEPTLTVAARMEGIKTLIPVGIVLLLVGLAVKVAAVPVHGWAAPTYDGASLPVAAFLSTASKFAGIISVLIVFSGLSGQSDVAGPTLAVLAVATMTVGNLVALRQRRMVRLLAWSSIAQGGYLLAPLGAMAAGGSERLTTFEATLAYTMFFLVLEFGAFAALIAVRGSQDGGEIAEYRGVARRSWWVGAALVLALTGLAGLPPGVAGLFAKVAVVQGLIDAGGVWLAVVVAINAVIALAYYARFIAVLFARPAAAEAPTSSERPSERPSQRPPAAEPARKLALVGAGRGGDGDSGDGAGGGGDSGDGAGGGSVPAAAPQPAPGPGAVPLTSPFAKPGIAVATTIAVVTLAGLVIGLAPQLVLDAARNAAEALVASLR
ncbi:MAG: NADH-quinone oxidoreductase subunit N [Micromonosporaceae bacterium]|nr:NADH-quinone oxidoreductase subunit N [Micromonosporaceae bacterium]